MVSLFIGVFLSQLAVKLFGDWCYKKYKKRIINHTVSAIIDLNIYVVLAVLTFWGSWLAIVGGVVAQLGGRWVFYDLLYNLVNKHRWDHYGKSSRLDRWLTQVGRYHIVPKIGTIVVGIILILV